VAARRIGSVHRTQLGVFRKGEVIPKRRTASRTVVAKGASIGTAIVLTVGLVVASTVSASSHDPTAETSKRKCKKKQLWKCAPKRYHLSVTDTVGPGSQSAGFEEHWRAEVDLTRYRRNIGHVDYSQAGGTLDLSSTSTTECIGGPGMIRVEPQTLPLPAADLNDSDFAVFFTLLGPDKNTYGGPLGVLGAGDSNIIGTAIEECPDETRTFQFTFHGPTAGGMEGRGKVGKVLSGSGVSNTIFAHDSFSWKLTPKK
jgi:hypothetical protein